MAKGALRDGTHTRPFCLHAISSDDRYLLDQGGQLQRISYMKVSTNPAA